MFLPRRSSVDNREKAAHHHHSGQTVVEPHHQDAGTCWLQPGTPLSKPDPRGMGGGVPPKQSSTMETKRKANNNHYHQTTTQFLPQCGHTTCKNCTMAFPSLPAKDCPATGQILDGGHAALLWLYTCTIIIFQSVCSEQLQCASHLRTFSVAECRHVRLLFTDLYAVDEMCREGIANKQRLGLQSVALVTLMRPPACRENAVANGVVAREQPTPSAHE